MLEVMATNSSEKFCLSYRNLDDFLSYNDFVECCEKMEFLTNHSDSLYIVLFPSNEGYLHVNERSFRGNQYCSDYVDHFIR